MKKLMLFILLTITTGTTIFAYNWYKYLRVQGEAQTINFTSYDGTKFHGTLFTPKSAGPHPAIILLHGSGPASGTPPFVKIHANAFLNKGISVLVYDKRGSGQTGGDFDTATFDDFIEDALASLDMLRSRDDVISHKIALFASSESGWFAPEIAVRAGEITFIINRAGPPLSWIETNLWERRNELLEAGNNDETKIAEFLQLRQQIWRYYQQAALAHDPLLEVRAKLESALRNIEPIWLEASPMRVGEYEQEKFERYLIDILYDPTPFLLKLNIPILSLHGEADQNVPTAKVVEVYEQLQREQGKSIKVIVYPDYTHGMGKWSNIFSAGYPPSYLSSINQWADTQFN